MNSKIIKNYSKSKQQIYKIMITINKVLINVKIKLIRTL